MTQSQAACVGAEALPLYEKEAKERQQIRKGNQPGATNSPKLDELGRADEFAAQDFKVAARYFSYYSADFCGTNPIFFKMVQNQNREIEGYKPF